MNVFVVHGGIHYEGDRMLGVFSSEEAAKMWLSATFEHRAHQWQDRDVWYYKDIPDYMAYDDIDIDEWILDKPEQHNG